jgi:multiple sugar transport system substrate-binding protein
MRGKAMNMLLRCLLFACLSTVAIVLSACGGAAQKSASPSAAGDSIKKEPVDSAITRQDEPVELWFRLYVGSIRDEDKFMSVFGNMIQKKFPNVTPKFIAPAAMDKLIANNQPIDIIYDAYGEVYKNLIAYNMQFDVSEFIKKYNYDLTPLEPTSVAAMQKMAGGGMYGLPVGNDSANITYNKGLFDRLGVPYPKDDMTWEEAYELTKKMSRTMDGVRYYGIGVSPQHAALADELSPVFIDPTTNKSAFSSDKFRGMFETLTHFFTIAGNEVDSKTWGYAAQRKLFSEHKMAMLLGPSATGPRLFADKDPSLDWDIVSYPRYKDRPSVGPQLAPGYFLIPVSSKNKQAAFKVSAYVTSQEFQIHLARNGYAPVLKDANIWSEYGKDLPFMKGKNIKALIPQNSASIAPLSEYQDIALKELQSAFKDVMVDKKDINTALREADERIDKAIAAEKKK